MNARQKKYFGIAMGTLAIVTIIGIILWLFLRNKSQNQTTFYNCTKNGCIEDASGNRNYPNDLDGCNKDCGKSGPYYNCDSNGNCSEDTSGGRNYPGDSNCGGQCTPAPGPPGGGVVPNDKTDCLALNYYGKTNGFAPQKICGVFDGFSHWTWNDMKRWLAYFKQQTGATDVIIYEAQFIPESWLTEVGVTIQGPDKGSKSPANLLPKSCTSDTDCTGPNPSGTVPGLNWECQNGICVDKCTQGTPPKCNDDKACATAYKNMHCPFGGWCKTNGSCHYNTPHSGANATKTCTKATDCNCKGDYCNIKKGASSGACHITLPDGTCPKIPGAGGTCPKSKCPGSTAAYCGTNGWCKQCFDKNGNIITTECKTKEDYGASTTLWSPWKEGANAPPPSKQTAAFSNYYTSVGSLWDGKNLKGVKGDAGAALCPYGTYYDPDPDDKTRYPYGQCVDHQRKDCLDGTNPIMGFCDDPNYHKEKIPNGSSLLPTITLTWYALVGKAQTDGPTAINYIQTVLNFCNHAGITRLAFPFIVPDAHNTPYMIENTDGKMPDATTQVTNAINWIVKNVLNPAKKYKVGIGLNVYASYKDSRWQSWWRGGGNPACWTDPCVGKTQKDCSGTCGWQQTKDGDCACATGKANCEGFTTSPSPTPKPMTPDPCSQSSSSSYCNTGSCSWPYIATFIQLLNKAAKKNNTQNVTFLQVDQEWCHCGDVKDNVECVNKILGSDFEFTIATSLGTPGSMNPKYTSVPEVYWDAGNQFPCTGGPGTYQYLTPGCTTGTSHRKLQNKPTAFYDLIAGDSAHLGSDNKGDAAKQNAWLGRGKFAATVDSLKDKGKLTVTPSFSIENLSMCSSPNEMVLTGDVKQGTGRWECLPPKN